MTSYFAPEVAKYPQNSPKPQNSVRAYCLAALVMQFVRAVLYCNVLSDMHTIAVLHVGLGITIVFLC